MRCSNPACHVGDGEGCAVGERDHATHCPHWNTVSSTQSEATAAASAAEDAYRAHWSGAALGLTDLGNLLPRGRSLLVGALGAHDAGKTTLLVGTYLACLRGHQLAGARFAGSRTLGAWEALSAWLRYEDAARAPSFPPHTPRGTARVPGLLHLALRERRGSFRDVLLTDAPGEWFTRWSIKEDAPEAEGARWVVRHADAFMLVVDCKRLAGPERGQARSDIRQIIERLSDHVAGRPTILVWAKSDIAPATRVRTSISESLRALIPHAREVESTAERPETLAAAVEGAIQAAWTPPRSRPIDAPVLGGASFAAFRGFNAQS
ncbi:MAG: hypothetical protein Q8P41_04795 [Pseudomonadota bacterium]|nr:hypothetical protein [Pseudomonadota bacterium]